MQDNWSFLNFGMLAVKLHETKVQQVLPFKTFGGKNFTNIISIKHSLFSIFKKNPWTNFQTFGQALDGSRPDSFDNCLNNTRLVFFCQFVRQVKLPVKPNSNLDFTSQSSVFHHFNFISRSVKTFTKAKYVYNIFSIKLSEQKLFCVHSILQGTLKTYQFFVWELFLKGWHPP